MKLKHLTLLTTTFWLLSCVSLSTQPPADGRYSSPIGQPEPGEELVRSTVTTWKRAPLEQVGVPQKTCHAFREPRLPERPEIPEEILTLKGDALETAYAAYVLKLHTWMDDRDSRLRKAYTAHRRECPRD